MPAPSGPGAAVPWFIAPGQPVRKNPNGPAGIIRGDVPPGTEYVGVEWSDGHSSMQPVADLIRWEPRLGELVTRFGSGWVDTVIRIEGDCCYLARVPWARFLHELRPKMQSDVWIPVPGEQVRVRLTNQVGIVRPPWVTGEHGHRVDLGDGDDRKFLAYELAPLPPMAEV